MKSNSKQETKTVIKAIFAWEDEKEEKWLEEMALNGWELEKVIPYIYTFRRCPPKRMVYRLDFRNDFSKEYHEYQSFFKDAGWELVARFSCWHYYRIKPENGEVPEIYNSNKAKAEKYRRLLWIALLPLSLSINPLCRTIESLKERGQTPLNIGFEVFFVAVFAFVIYAIIRLWMKIKNFESKSQE